MAPLWFLFHLFFGWHLPPTASGPLLCSWQCEWTFLWVLYMSWISPPYLMCWTTVCFLLSFISSMFLWLCRNLVILIVGRVVYSYKSEAETLQHWKRVISTTGTELQNVLVRGQVGVRWWGERGESAGRKWTLVVGWCWNTVCLKPNYQQLCSSWLFHGSLH